MSDAELYLDGHEKAGSWQQEMDDLRSSLAQAEDKSDQWKARFELLRWERDQEGGVIDDLTKEVERLMGELDEWSNESKIQSDRANLAEKISDAFQKELKELMGHSAKYVLLREEFNANLTELGHLRAALREILETPADDEEEERAILKRHGIDPATLNPT